MGRDPNRGKLVGFGEYSPYGAGVNPIAVLNVTGNGVTGQYISVGAEQYELSVVQTDTGVNTITGQLDNTNAYSVVTIATHGLVVGDLILVELEIMKVVAVVDVNTVRVSRGHSATTKASHAAAEDIYKAAASATAGRIEVGLGATVTAAYTTAALEAVINAESQIGLVADKVSDAELLVAFNGPVPATMALAENFTNGAWLIDTTTVGGQLPEDSAGPMAVQARVPDADEVTIGNMSFHFPFSPKFVSVLVTVTASGAEVLWGGAITLSGRRVTLTNGTDPDWAATDTVRVLALG